MKQGYEVICPDLPLYGMTEYYGKVVYQDWVDCAAEIVMYYQAREIRPTFLFGLSTGGILAYQTASGLPEIQGVIATCLLDQREPLVREKRCEFRVDGRTRPQAHIKGIRMAGLYKSARKVGGEYEGNCKP